MPVFRWCAGCAADTAFDALDCVDHGADCLELVCRDCGLGIELAAVVVAVEPSVVAVGTAA